MDPQGMHEHSPPPPPEPTPITTPAAEPFEAYKTASGIQYSQYSPAAEATLLPALRTLITPNLSEPYSIYVYRYFLYEWPSLCFLASLPAASNPASSDAPQTPGEVIGVILCKLEPHRGGPLRGYIAMLATAPAHRGQGIGATLVRHAVAALRAAGADEVALETEVGNAASLRLYERAGFVRAKRLAQFYLNGSEAFRLVLYLREGAAAKETRPVVWEGLGGEHDEEDGGFLAYPGVHELEV